MGGAKRYPSILPVWRWVSLRSTHPTISTLAALDAENHRHGKAQAIVRDQRRRRRHRIGSPHHRQRRFVKNSIARTLFNRRRQHVTQPVEREADVDFGGLLLPFRWIALVLVEMRHQFLLPGRAHALGGRAASDRRRGRTRAFRDGL